MNQPFHCFFIFCHGKIAVIQTKTSHPFFAGYPVPGNEYRQVISLRTDCQAAISCGVGLRNVVRGDLDGNGRAISDFVCPTGPGQVKKPPN